MSATRKCPYCGAGWAGRSVSARHLAACARKSRNIPTATDTQPHQTAAGDNSETDYDALYGQYRHQLPPDSERAPATIAVSASALFDTRESETIFTEQGLDAYSAHQAANLDEPLQPGPAMPLVQRLLALNTSTGQRVVDVIILSKNDENTGARISKAVETMGLDIRHVEFLGGNNPTAHAHHLDVDLLLSGSEGDIRDAIQSGLPGGHVHPSTSFHDDDKELVVAFDFDGVLASDESEQVFAEGGVAGFNQHETDNVDVPHTPGPMQPFLKALNRIQDVERKIAEVDPDYKPQVRVTVVTARGIQSAERAVNSIKSWGCRVDDALFLAGMEKAGALAMIKPHIFFDDQRRHLEGVGEHTTGTHVPYGVRN